jgi:Protein of unknown function (DUF2637)
VSPRITRVLAVVTLLGMIPVTVIGFAASYSTLAKLAEANGFSAQLAPWIPLGIDGAIIAFLAMDLYLTARRIPWPLLRFAAHGMTLATVVFNASESALGGGQAIWEDPVRAAWHGVMPLLFVVGVEGARRLLVHVGRLQDGTAADRIPLHRWALAPARTGRLYRRMRLANVTSYPEMVERERALAGYRVWLAQELGGDLSKASEVQMLPITMARHGYTVEEALALPAQWETEAAERARAEVERAALAEAESAERAAELEITKLKSAGRVEAARHQVQAETGAAEADAEAVTAQAKARAESARARAESLRAQAELAATAEAEAFQSKEAAAMLRQAAEDEKAAAQADAEAEAERRRAQAERTEAERLEAEAAEQRRRNLAVEAEAERATADAEAERLRAAEARRRIAVMEAEGATADAWAGLTPREIKVRRVARLIVASGGNAENAEVISLRDIEAAVGAARTTAGELRQEAAMLLAGGYDPMTAYVPQSWR